jgi:hypothetical protein
MSDDLSARFQELFWALPSGTMRHKLRSLEIDIGRTLRDVRESLDALTPGLKTGYDWNADPLSLTLVMGRAYEAIATLGDRPALAALTDFAREARTIADDLEIVAAASTPAPNTHTLRHAADVMRLLAALASQDGQPKEPR